MAEELERKVVISNNADRENCSLSFGTRADYIYGIIFPLKDKERIAEYVRGLVTATEHLTGIRPTIQNGAIEEFPSFMGGEPIDEKLFQEIERYANPPREENEAGD
ncbi:MAG: hypothetical protein PHH00_01550 [Candidatus Nanoarchaeia archaeon]|nr:hypothetical protein [Candidatus Nanoarchaeia archaeon]